MKETCLYAGAGRAEIQLPPAYFPQEGYTGIHDGIYARAVILECGARVVIVSLELPSIRPYSLFDRLRQQISQLTGAAPGCIWICVTHDTSAPHVPKEEEKHKLHMDAVWNAIRAAVSQAAAAMKPARLGVGTGETRVNVSRNILTRVGWWQGLNPNGYSDHTLTVVRVEDLHGRPVALLYNLDVRPWVMVETVLDGGMRQVTGDLTGEASRQLEAQYDGAVALFLMGAAADQVPAKKGHYYVTDENGALCEVQHGPESYALLSALAAELAGEVAATAEQTVCTDASPQIVCAQTSFFWKGQRPYDLPDRNIPHPKKVYHFEAAEDQEILIHLMRLGELALVGIQPEISSVTGTHLRQSAPFPHTMLVDMVNGGQAYMPCREAYQQLLPDAMNALVAEGAAEAFLDEARKALWKLKKQEDQTDTFGKE